MPHAGEVRGERVCAHAEEELTVLDRLLDPMGPARAVAGYAVADDLTARQESNTSNLIFSIPELIAFISETCTLRAGDLILTGTPRAVGMGLDPPAFLRAGDAVRIEIERLGSIEHVIVD